MTYFVLYTKAYEYKSNLFLVEWEALAKELAEAMNKAHKHYWDFKKKELKAWKDQYDITNPPPAPCKCYEFNHVTPLPPPHLRALSNKEKRSLPEYKAFIKELEQYKLLRDIWAKEDQKLWREWNYINNKWESAKNEAINAFQAEHLIPTLKEILLFEVDLPERYADKLLPYVMDNYGIRFFYDKIDILR